MRGAGYSHALQMGALSSGSASTAVPQPEHGSISRAAVGTSEVVKDGVSVSISDLRGFAAASA
jgi:hypothetical protein